MTSGNPFGQRPEKPKPKIWAEGGQRPPFNLRALGTASLYLSRIGVAPLLAWSARTVRRVAVNVKNGVGRISGEKLGAAARFLPSHLRVAGWIKNLAAVLSHASATADPDVKRGNALVAEIEPHLWDAAEIAALTAVPLPATVPEPVTPAPEDPVGPEPVAPVTLPEPVAREYDPLAVIRDKLANQPAPGKPFPEDDTPEEPDLPPAPPSPLATTVIQVAGYLVGWASAIIALPYGLARALWLFFAKNVDLRTIAVED
jgi:hypothetical protein